MNTYKVELTFENACALKTAAANRMDSLAKSLDQSVSAHSDNCEIWYSSIRKLSIAWQKLIDATTV